VPFHQNRERTGAPRLGGRAGVVVATGSWLRLYKCKIKIADQLFSTHPVATGQEIVLTENTCTMAHNDPTPPGTPTILDTL
jgi:hypothetical protein